ncbi:MAG: hypothetical protein O3A01_01885 [bacterium]|nr:hypothetical protein [bacterium]
MSIGKIILEGYRLIKEDWIVATPYLIFSFISYLFTTQFQTFLNVEMPFQSYFIRSLAVNWVLEGFVISFTLAMCIAVVSKKSIEISSAGSMAFKRLFNMLLVTIWTVAPAIFISYHVAPKLVDPAISIPTHYIGLVLVVMVVNVVLVFADILVVGPQFGFVRSVLESAYLVAKNSMMVAKLILASIMVSISLQVLSIIMAGIPVVGESLFFVALQGFNFTLVSAMAVVVYYNGLRKQTTIVVDA